MYYDHGEWVHGFIMESMLLNGDFGSAGFGDRTLSFKFLLDLDHVQIPPNSSKYSYQILRRQEGKTKSFIV